MISRATKRETKSIPSIKFAPKGRKEAAVAQHAKGECDSHQTARRRRADASGVAQRQEPKTKNRQISLSLSTQRCDARDPAHTRAFPFSKKRRREVRRFAIVQRPESCLQHENTTHEFYTSSQRVCSVKRSNHSRTAPGKALVWTHPLELRETPSRKPEIAHRV